MMKGCMIGVCKGLKMQVLYAFLLLGCAELPPAPTAQVASDWKMIAEATGASAGCRNLEGKYSMAGQGLVHENGEWVSQTASELAFYSGLVGPAEADEIPKSLKTKSFSNDLASTSEFSFDLKMASTTELVLEYQAGDPDSYSIHFSGENGQFTCRGNHIIFPDRIDLSGGDGVQANTRRSRTMGLNSNGDLILYDQTSQARASMQALEPSFRIFKFPRK